MRTLEALLLMFIWIALALSVLLHVWTCRRLTGPMPSRSARIAVWTALSILLALMASVPLTWRLGRDMIPGSIRPAMMWISYGAMGLYSLLFSTLVVRELVWLAARLIDRLRGTDELLPSDPERRRWLAGMMNFAVLGTTGVLSGVGFREARRRAAVVDGRVPIKNLPPQLDGFRIVQLSDVHVGPTIRRDYLQAIVDEVNRLDADMVAITGDLVDGRVHELKDDVAPLAELRSRHGTYFCTGNHEYYAGAEEWAAELSRLGIHVLVNEGRTIEHGEGRVLVGGAADFRADRFVPAHASNPAACLEGQGACDVKILLAHQPRSIEEAQKAGFDLQLSGHTHGGQFFPWNFVVKLVHRYDAGLHDHEGTWIYVSRGTGYFGPPVRLGAPSEITRLHLVRA